MGDQARRELDPDVLGRSTYNLLTSVIIPRPIAWVSTVDADGVLNVAPHSFFTVSSVAPPVVQWTSVGVKDSLRNVRATGEFVVNISTEPMATLINATATDFPSELSEFSVVGLTPEPSTVVKVPRVAESPVAIECRLLEAKEFGGGSSTVVFGQVVHISMLASLIPDDEDPDRPMAASDRLAPVARLGRDEWSTLGRVFSLRRQPFTEWQQQ